MALEILKSPDGRVDAGLFNLPPGFDTKRWAVEWVEEGQVAFKQQRQTIPGANMSADGWSVYKGSETEDKKSGKQITVVNGAGKKFVLMVRPRQLQDDVNALCGNISKGFIRRETKGETVAGAQTQDPGMLPAPRLAAVDGQQSSSGEFGDTTPNVLSSNREEPSAVQST